MSVCGEDVSLPRRVDRVPISHLVEKAAMARALMPGFPTSGDLRSGGMDVLDGYEMRDRHDGGQEAAWA